MRLSVCVAKEKPDHAVIEYSVNKRMNDRSHLRLASKLLKKSLAHRGRFGTSEVLEGLLYSENRLHHSELEPSGFGHLARIPWRFPHEIKFHIGNTRHGSHLVFNLRRQ